MGILPSCGQQVDQQPDDGAIVARVSGLSWFRSEGPKLLYLVLYHARHGPSLPSLVSVNTTDLGRALCRPESTIRLWRNQLVARGLLVKVEGLEFRLHEPPPVDDQVAVDHAEGKTRPLFAGQDRPGLHVHRAQPTTQPTAQPAAQPAAFFKTPGGERTRDPEPGPSPLPGPTGNGKRNGNNRDLEADLLAEATEYQEIRNTPVEPSPPGRLAYGVFKPLLETDLKSAEQMVQWFRRQLGAPRPVTDANQGALLLVLAAAEYVMELPAREVRKTRVALFCSIVRHQNWRRALPNLPVARRTLDHLIEARPDLFLRKVGSHDSRHPRRGRGGDRAAS